jgi:hypothetical protein
VMGWFWEITISIMSGKFTVLSIVNIIDSVTINVSLDLIQPMSRYISIVFDTITIGINDSSWSSFLSWLKLILDLKSFDSWWCQFSGFFQLFFTWCWSWSLIDIFRWFEYVPSVLWLWIFTISLMSWKFTVLCIMDIINIVSIDILLESV